MKLKFDSNLTYQAEAVQAVVDIFDGQPLSQSGFEVSFTEQVGMVEQTELGLGNRLTLDDDQLLANVHEVQTRNEIEPVDELKGRQFSIEMETGTGKTSSNQRSQSMTAWSSTPRWSASLPRTSTAWTRSSSS